MPEGTLADLDRRSFAETRPRRDGQHARHVFQPVVTDDDPVNPQSSTADQVTISLENVNDPPSSDLARSICSDARITATPVPEPGVLVLLASGVVGLVGLDRVRRR